MNIIFLDIDGVLNTKNSVSSLVVNKDKTRLLNNVLEETNTSIVLSSTWRLIYDMCSLRKLLRLRDGTGISPHKIIDSTPNLIKYNRGTEINAWLCDYEDCRLESTLDVVVDDYLILDDSNVFTNYQIKNHLIAPESKVGLTKRHTRLMIKIFNSSRKYSLRSHQPIELGI